MLFGRVLDHIESELSQRQKTTKLFDELLSWSFTHVNWVWCSGDEFPHILLVASFADNLETDWNHKPGIHDDSCLAFLIVSPCFARNTLHSPSKYIGLHWNHTTNSFCLAKLIPSRHPHPLTLLLRCAVGGKERYLFPSLPDFLMDPLLREPSFGWFFCWASSSKSHEESKIFFYPFGIVWK